jgi:hypothetical protein
MYFYNDLNVAITSKAQEMEDEKNKYADSTVYFSITYSLSEVSYRAM